MATNNKTILHVLSYKGLGGHSTIIGIYSDDKKVSAAIRKFKTKNMGLKPGTGFIIDRIPLDTTNAAAVRIVNEKLDKERIQ